MVYIYRHPQKKRTEATVIPMSATAASSNHNNDTLDDAEKYEDPVNSTQDSDDHAYRDLKQQSVPHAGKDEGVGSGDIYVYHKPSARYKLDDQQHSPEVWPTFGTFKGN